MSDAPVINPIDSAIIDISTAVLLSRFLKFCRRWLVVFLFISALAVVLRPSLPSGGAVALAAMFYVGVRRLHRWALIIWTWLLLVFVIAAAGWCLHELIKVLEAGFTPWLVLPFGVITIIFCFSARALRQEESIDSAAPELENAAPFASMPSFGEIWLQGGWRTMLFISVAWQLSFAFFIEPQPSVFYACLLFALAGTCVMVIPWVLIPILKTLRTDWATGLLKTVAHSRAKGRGPSYAFFALRNGLRRPLAFLAAAVLVLLLVCISVVFALFWRVTGSLVVLVALALLTAWMFCLRTASRYMLRGAVETTAVEGKPFALYLRSFLDDQVKVLRDGLLYRVWLVDPLWNLLRFVRFEEVLVETIWPYDRILALGRPGESLPQLGALRVDVNSGDWQQVITSYMKDAERILMTVGFTSGLKWEFRTLSTPIALSKLSLVFIPESPQSTVSNWRAFASDRPDLLSHSDEMIKRALAVRFDDAGLPLFIIASRRSVAAYRLALAICWLPLAELLELRQKARNATQPLHRVTAST